MTNQTLTEKAWNEYQKNLLAFIRPKVDTLEDAEDLLVDVFAALIVTQREGGTPNNLVRWLYSVTRNKIVDYYRTRKRYDELPEDLFSEGKTANIMDQLSHCLLPMIRVLPENYQRPLILSEIQGKKYQEVAIELDLSLPAVKSRILRGREKLYKKLLACCLIKRDALGNVMDYQLKEASSCGNCNC